MNVALSRFSFLFIRSFAFFSNFFSSQGELIYICLIEYLHSHAPSQNISWSSAYTRKIEIFHFCHLVVHHSSGRPCGRGTMTTSYKNRCEEKQKIYIFLFWLICFVMSCLRHFGCIPIRLNASVLSTTMITTNGIGANGRRKPNNSSWNNH